MIDKKFWKDKKVFITGHTGFKGSWLSFILKLHGAKVAGYSLKPDIQPALFEILNLNKTLDKSWFADIRDLNTLQEKMNEFQPEVVFHLAAQPLVTLSYQDPVNNFSTNLMGTVNVFESIRQLESVKRVINVTTDKVYENLEQGEAFKENHPLGGHDPYSASKACSEIITTSYRKSFLKDKGVIVSSARAGNVIGGGDWAVDRLVPDLIRSFASGRYPIIRNPNSIRPWQHVLEPLGGYILLAQKGIDEAFNFGPSLEDCLPVQELVKKLMGYWNSEMKIKIEEAKFHEANLLKLDNSKAKSILNWAPKLSVEQAIQKTAVWYKEFYTRQDVISLTEKQIFEYFG
jgi:CDP-glucose 4,6-dehydratase